MDGVGDDDAGDNVPFVVGGAYIMILFSAFGGLISERVTLEENPKFKTSFLGGIFVLCL